VGVFGTRGSQGGLEIVPVEVEIEPQSASVQAEPPTAALPRPDAAHSSDAATNGVARLSAPDTDALKAKLDALAKLRQPDVTTPSEENGAAGPDRVAKNDDITSGLEGPFSVKDYIRAQVERRWNPDLAALRNHEVSVPIHVEITSAGVVLKAEIVDTARAADPDYHEIAVSARNAVLLSSPIALPPGHYQDVMDMVLYLDPREALR
jgi:outer membrane biosynthesis protein TonB